MIACKKIREPEDVLRWLVGQLASRVGLLTGMLRGLSAVSALNLGLAGTCRG